MTKVYLNKFFLFFLIISGILVFSSCSTNNKIDPTFYYWKTIFTLTPQEKEFLDSLGIKKLYIRFFDVDFQPDEKKTKIVEPVTFQDNSSTAFEIIPTIFITNKSLVDVPLNQIEELSSIIYYNVSSIAASYSLFWNQIQLDCDWTEKTKDKFFKLSGLIMEKAHKNGKSVSATIRLHQIKYFKRTGVPPVDRGMLMCYNIGSISADTTINSIYNNADASKYATYIKSYPMMLDAALPVFSNAIHIRDRKPIRLLSKNFLNDLPGDSPFTTVKANRYVADSSFFYHGIYFMKNDIIKIENTTPGITLEAAELLMDNLPASARTIALFDLDMYNIKRYKYESIKKIFDCFK